jgi:hypothetical protein
MWKDLPDDVVVRARPPSRLTAEDAEANYEFRSTDRSDPVELIQRVCNGVKPMATLLLRTGREIQIASKTLVDTCKALGLDHEAFFMHGGRREVAVFQVGATLSLYYDQEAVLAQYEEAGISLDPAIFSTPIGRFARGVITEGFPEAVKFPIIGLCLGYPVAETIALIKLVRGGLK